MGPPLKAAENHEGERLVMKRPRASMGPPLKAAENHPLPPIQGAGLWEGFNGAAAKSSGKYDTTKFRAIQPPVLQWGRR